MLPILESFFSLPPELMTALGTVLGFATLGDLTADQQNSLGNFLILIGQILETNSSQKQLLEDLAAARSMEQLRQEVQRLKEQLDAQKGSAPAN